MLQVLHQNITRYWLFAHSSCPSVATPPRRTPYTLCMLGYPPRHVPLRPYAAIGVYRVVYLLFLLTYSSPTPGRETAAISRDSLTHSLTHSHSLTSLRVRVGVSSSQALRTSSRRAHNLPSHCRTSGRRNQSVCDDATVDHCLSARHAPRQPPPGARLLRPACLRTMVLTEAPASLRVCRPSSTQPPGPLFRLSRHAEGGQEGGG